jgi:aminoglycoside phosphotransferase (APT) family kinase protein
MSAQLPRRLDATDDDLERGRAAARMIATTVSGRDPGPLTTAVSMSHYVYLGTDIVVKLVDAAGHTRMDREIALARELPPGLGAPLLASGRSETNEYDVRYACFARLPGVPARPDLPGVDAVTARRWADRAARLLVDLHSWTPSTQAAAALRAFPPHEGFISRCKLLSDIESVRTAPVPPELLDGLVAIAERAPDRARTDVPVHADGDWGNWLVDDHDVVALLDFERARFGEPADDWVLLAIASGPHLGLVVDAISEATGTPAEEIRAACELRHITFVADELGDATWLSRGLQGLEDIVLNRRWW